MTTATPAPAVPAIAAARYLETGSPLSRAQRASVAALVFNYVSLGSLGWTIRERARQRTLISR
jgi:hypothetical protein